MTVPPAASAASTLDVRDLRVDFATERGWVNVVDDVSLTVGQGEVVGLVGESGSGKSVTSLSVLGLLPEPPSRNAGGQVLFKGEDISAVEDRRLREIRGNEIAMIFQEPMTSLNPAFTIGEQIAEAVRLHRRGGRRAARERAAEILSLVGIPDARRRLGAYPHEFSGGMRQRVMIALALACDPELLIADEPTTALDVTVQAQILDLLLDLRDRTGLGILLVTHDLGVVAQTCDRVVVMYAGRVVEAGPVEDIFTAPKHPYTVGLLASMPQQETRSGRLATIPGSTPEPWNFATGCRFAPRCGEALPLCSAMERPPLRPVGPSHASACLRVDDISREDAR